MRNVCVVAMGMWLVSCAPARLPPDLPSPLDALVSIRGLTWPESDGTAPPVRFNRCTVFAIHSTRHLWLTAGHCVEQPTMLEIDHAAARVVTKDAASDLAILETPTLRDVPALSLQATTPELGQPVHVLGFPFGWESPTFGSGAVMTLQAPLDEGEHQYLLLMLMVGPGDSGSPILNTHNEVVSVVQHGVGYGGCRPVCLVVGGVPWMTLKTVTDGYWSRP